MDTPRKLRIGIIGAGEVSQVIHLPTLALLSHLYTPIIIADVSSKTAEHCAAKFHIPNATTNALDVCRHANVDAVFVFTSDEFHEPYAIAALEAGKHVLIEKPVSLSIPSVQRIIAAERRAAGPRVFVGYMRRYATSFTQTFRREIATIPRILYARARDFSGPNAKFVRESGTFPFKDTDDINPEAVRERDARLTSLFDEAFPGQTQTADKTAYWRFLGSLGSHDISLLRDALGSPRAVTGVSVHHPFYSANLEYDDVKNGTSFAVTYESGIDAVPEFDAHLAIYGETKRVAIYYDSPYVKGLPIRVVVHELNAAGEMEKREILGSYEDAYTSELTEFYNCVVNGREIRTSAEDALLDLKIFDMMFKTWLGLNTAT